MANRRPSDLWQDNTVSLDVGDTLVLSGNVTLSDSKAFIGLVSVGGGVVGLGAGAANIGLATVSVALEPGYSYAALYSLVTLAVKGSAGVLHSVNINGSSLPTIEIYDSTTASGALLARFVEPKVGSYIFDAAFGTGLTINPQPGTAVLPNITVTYR